MNDSDESLVQRAQRRDRSAFEQLVRRTARIVYSRIYLDTGDAHRAEDLTQETFLSAWRSIHQVVDASGFRSWLLTIAQSVVTDALRREGRKKRSGVRVDGNQALPRLADPRQGPPDVAEQTEQRERMLELLQSMPAEYREPLMLRYIAGADYDSIGQQLGLSNGSLRGLLHRGMNQLREAMKRLEAVDRSSNAGK